MHFFAICCRFTPVLFSRWEDFLQLPGSFSIRHSHSCVYHSALPEIIGLL